ncbi:MAG: MFS transporter, partial [Bacteroidales bacterium]|nr:MFS transporter [Bacteroidales bacterium]
MTELLKQKLNDSAVARWSVLAIVSLTMMCGYFLTDAMSPLMTMLEEEMAWTSKEFGIFNWAYCWFNVFLFMLIFGGLILDKMGVRFTGTMACILMVIGCGLKYYAVEFISPLPEAGTILGIRTQVMVACLGYAIFAVGTETCGITVTKVIAKWFAGKEMALAMGSQVAVARLGTALAMIVSPVLVKHFSMSTPMFVSLILLCIGLLFYLVVCVMDRKLDAQTQSEGIPADEDSFRISDLKLILTNKGFWLLALLCLMFYSAVFPFLKYATSLMENKYGM